MKGFKKKEPEVQKAGVETATIGEPQPPKEPTLTPRQKKALALAKEMDEVSIYAGVASTALNVQFAILYELRELTELIRELNTES